MSYPTRAFLITALLAAGCGPGAETAEEDGGVSGDGGSILCGNGVVDPDEECDDGNTVPNDGCESDCKKTIRTLEVRICPGDGLPAPAEGACEVTSGSGGFLVTSTVLTPGIVYRGGQVFIDGSGKIACVDCDCSVAAGGATQLVCPDTVLTPGLINPHDHITYTQNFPFTLDDPSERFQHRHDWRKGKHGHEKVPAAGGASSEEVSWGELRFLIGGATSTVGSGGSGGLLRNLDKANLEEDLGQPPALFEVFPLGDSGGTLIESGCGYASNRDTAETALSVDSYLPHIGEGIDLAARNEFVCVSEGKYDLVQPTSAFIHGVGTLAADISMMATERTKLIWSPRSNISLYGDTAAVTLYGRLGATIALGTDWVISGSMNMLRELACVDGLNQTYYDHFFTDQDLWFMVTRNAAVVLAMDDVVGELKPGYIADVALFRKGGRVDHRAIIEGQPQDVSLVMRAGKVLYGDAALVQALGGSECDSLDVCGVDKRVCLQQDVGKSYAALAQANSGSYPLFFCGAPDNEPTCKPSRTRVKDSVNGSTIYDGTPSLDDLDGDGIMDTGDNCPHVFNPIRPMDSGQQADFDGDGVGDVCDPCPLDADTTQCAAFNPDDLDGDGVVNAVDNCSTVPNADQADLDNDGKGDLCDPCRDVSNPGDNACPATIYDVKDGTIPVGQTVALANALVTAVHPTLGFFLQAKEGDPDYAFEDYSGVFVYQKNPQLQAGVRVRITSAMVANYYGQIELTNVVLTAGTVVEALPVPIDVSPGEIATGGSRATTLEGVLVRVSNSTGVMVVTDIAPSIGAGDKAPINEFVVANEGSTVGVRVNDYLHLITPFPTAGQRFASITGILRFANENSKIEPRGAGDLVSATP